MGKLSIIIPCFCNEGNIPDLGKELLEEEKNFPKGTEIEYILVDDVSEDNTLYELLDFKSLNPGRVKVLKLAENVGSNDAVLAGLSVATGDCIAVMAADGQDPPHLLPVMYGHWQKGNKYVIAYREVLHTGFKNKTISNIFHLTMMAITKTIAPLNGFDMVIFDKELAIKLENEKIKNANLFYCLLQMERKPIKIPFAKRVRTHGHSMWTFSKKFRFLKGSISSFLPFASRVKSKKIRYTISEFF